MAEEHDTEILVRDARILSLDPAHDGRVSSVRVVGERIAAVTDSGLAAGAQALEIPAAGATLVPLLDATVLGEHPERDGSQVPNPGSQASFVVVAGGVTRSAALHQLVVTPERLVLAVVDGQIVARDGEPIVDSRAHADAVGALDPRWGTWVDRTGYLHQHLHSTCTAPDATTRPVPDGPTSTWVPSGSTGTASSTSTTRASGPSAGSSTRNCTTPDS